MIKKLICFGLAAVAALTLAAGELHPETQTFLAGMPSGLAELQTKAIREAIAGNGALLKQVRNSRKVDTVPPSGVTTEELSFEGLPIRLYRTPGPVRVLVLYLHGGGWVLGGIPSCSRFCGALAEQEEVAVAACDYRLAPEHPYPAALDDTVKFYDWAKQRYPGARIILAGDSAG
ncbi:MAG TPA: alpha/beta hydrolase, partial [Victivallis vadensis]|nr:alpha/beta hydrolase [Victivallis vadensis]